MWFFYQITVCIWFIGFWRLSNWVVRSSQRWFSCFEFEANKLGNIKELLLEQRPLLNRSSKLKREGPMSTFKTNVRELRALLHSHMYISNNRSVTCHDVDRQTDGRTSRRRTTSSVGFPYVTVAWRKLLAWILFKHMAHRWFSISLSFVIFVNY